MSGIHGLAATFGRIPFDNHTSSVLIKAGPMTANSADAAITYLVMAQNDLDGFYGQLYDGGVHGPPFPSLHGIHNIEDLSDVKLGIYKQWFDDSDPKVRTRSYEVVEFLKSKGAKIVEIEIPHMQAILLAQGIKIASEFAVGWDSIFHNSPER
jgi:Asp-tRNA(Asn)/Glu-tRNA(Gln) amidotransferase A subunit family amidase